jgi:hypothetical protein
MQNTRMTGPKRASLEARPVELEERIAALARLRKAADSLDPTVLGSAMTRSHRHTRAALVGRRFPVVRGDVL